MRHTLPIAPQFYVTAPQPCPYLAGRMERKLFTALQGDYAGAMNDTLSKQGFRRSQNVLYRPACAECQACMSARIRVADFTPSRSQRRVQRRNAGLQRDTTSAWATEEQYALFRKYLDRRHAAGGMADMDIFEFAAMIEETPVRARVVEYARPADPEDAGNGRAGNGRAGNGRAGNGGAAGKGTAPERASKGGARSLQAVCLTDVLDDGVSLVYSFFDPDRSGDSLGTHIILDHVELARAAGLPYVYLGYWVPGSEKMDYKARFSALEIHYRGKWRPLGDPDAYGEATHPLEVPPIAEQVARIALPDSMSVESLARSRATAIRRERGAS